MQGAVRVVVHPADRAEGGQRQVRGPHPHVSQEVLARVLPHQHDLAGQRTDGRLREVVRSRLEPIVARHDLPHQRLHAAVGVRTHLSQRDHAGVRRASHRRGGRGSRDQRHMHVHVRVAVEQVRGDVALPRDVGVAAGRHHRERALVHRSAPARLGGRDPAGAVALLLPHHHGRAEVLGGELRRVRRHVGPHQLNLPQAAVPAGHEEPDVGHHQGPAGLVVSHPVLVQEGQALRRMPPERADVPGLGRDDRVPERDPRPRLVDGAHRHRHGEL